MAEHQVTNRRSCRKWKFVNTDLRVAVFSRRSRNLGNLTISRGGLGWFPSGRSNERHFNWEQFARYVKEWKG